MARAFAAEPQLLLLDEPTAGVGLLAAGMIEELVAATTRSGTKVLLVSHNLNQVGRLADEVIVRAHGRAVEQGLTRQVISALRSAEARAHIKRELPWTSYAAVF
ncbi:P-loop NTPase family protein [Methylobacterium fujisawaense]|uniref:hypothetical protein n=1 Tax=Methylobacterium fujisawaense TaxID=107400 RepID=UPI003CC7A629